MANPEKAIKANRELSITRTLNAPIALSWEAWTKPERIIHCWGPDDNHLVEEIIGRTGATIMGLRMLEEGEVNWPENAPFHGPVFVTHKKREPWKRLSRTTFY